MFIENIVLESCNVDNAKTSTAARTERIFILFILVFLPKMCFYWHSVCADTSCIISLIEIAVLRWQSNLAIKVQCFFTKKNSNILL